MEIKIKFNNDICSTNIPIYHNDGDAGFDLSANSILALYSGDIKSSPEKLKLVYDNFKKRKYIKIRPFERILFGTGISVKLPKGYELQIRSRSGLALKKGLIILNSPGTIDSGYTGEIGVILYNSTSFLSTVNINDRICQAVLCKYETAEFKVVDELEPTERGSAGFGSTGN